MEKAAISIITNKSCTGCFACYNKCPFDAIKMVINNEGFYKPIIDPKKCTNCGLCSLVCPVINYKVEITDNNECFSAYTKDDAVLKKSSSGGIFTELAKEIIEDGGIVFGVQMNGLLPNHVMIDTKEDLEKLRGSKYLPSEVGNSYNTVKELVKTRKVLFSGTPCQIAAMKLFVKSENLITVDIVCHGVPSLTVFEKSITDRFKEIPSVIEFRNKNKGWENSKIHYKLANKSLFKSKTEDEWFAAYLKDLFLMESCYDCKFNLRKRPGDISLADYWGISKVDPCFYKENNDKGVSVVILNTDKGISLYNKIQNRIISKKQDINLAEKYNSRINYFKYPIHYMVNRNKFFDNLKNVDFSKKNFADSHLKIYYKKLKSKLLKIVRG